MTTDQLNNSIHDFIREISQAMRARGERNEGKARVCARRAAGIAAEEFLRRTGRLPASNSASVRLKALAEVPNIPHRVKILIPHFLIHVNTDHTLPIDADLIQDARQLANELLGWDNKGQA
jgi:hypothetical protein